MSVVTVNELKKSFQGDAVIKGVSFNLKKERCIALLGPNGAGKTTILKMLSGLMMPSSGSIVFDGLEKGSDPRSLIGYLPQHPVFYEWMTGKEFLEYVGKLAGMSNSEGKTRSNELLELVGIAEAKNKRIGKYSGGMKQRLGIAQAIIHRPKLVMLDEPVSALDPLGRREVLELLQKLRQDATILFSTHILNDAEEICDDILFLHKGELVESGPLVELREKHQQAKIDLVFRQDTAGIMESLSAKGLFSSYGVEANTASVFSENIDELQRKILQEVLKENLPLTKFEISKTSLEDVFMKVVQS